MPLLKQLNCTLQNAQSKISSVPMQEHNTIYLDGYVETHIAVPSSPTPFSIRLQSQGFIAPGLAMFVFIDGVYQCNRNRTNLKIPDGSKARTEVDFVVRQREEAMPDGTFRGKLWRFGDVNAVSIPGDASHLAGDVGTIEVLVLRCLPLAPKPNTTMGPKNATKAHFVPIDSESSDEESPSSDDSLSGLGGMLDGASDYPPNRGRKGVDWEAGQSSGKGAGAHQNRNSRGRSKNQHSIDWENVAKRNNHESSTDTQLDLSRGAQSRREKRVPPGGMINPTASVVGPANDSVAALVSPAVVININSNSAPSGIKNTRDPPRRGKVWKIQSDENSSDLMDTSHDGRMDHNRRQTSHSNTKGANPGMGSKSRDRNSKNGPNMPGAWTDPVDQDQNQPNENSWNDDDKGSNAAFGDNNKPQQNNNSDWGAGEDDNSDDNHWGDNEKKDDRNANSKGWDGKKTNKGVENKKKTKKKEVGNNGGSGNAWGNSADNGGWGNDNTGPDAPNLENKANGSNDGNGNGNGNGSPAVWDSPKSNTNQSQKGSWDSRNENNNQQNGWGADTDGKTQQNNSGHIVNHQKNGQKQKSNPPNDQQNSWGGDNHDDKPQHNNSGGDDNNGDAQKSGWEVENSENAQQNSSGGDNNGNAQENKWTSDNDGDAQQDNPGGGNNGDTQQNNWVGDNNGDTQQNNWAGDNNGNTQQNNWAGDNNGNTQSNDWVDDRNDTQQNSGNIPSKNTQASGGKVADKDSWKKPPYPVTGKPPYSPLWPPSPPPIHFPSTAPHNASGLGIGNLWSTLPNSVPIPMSTPRGYKPYWSTWRQSDGIQSKLASMDPADGIWEPLCRVPLEVVRHNNLSHQVHLSQPAQYSHRQLSPTYMDSFENPYAVFVFHYRSKEILEQMLKRQLDEPEMVEKKKLAELSKEELIEEVLKAQAAASQGVTGIKGSSDPKRLVGMNKALKASYKVSKLTDDDVASDTDPDHDWGRKEKDTSKAPPIWNSASPSNREFWADWTGGGNAGAMVAATSATVPAATYGGNGYTAPTAPAGSTAWSAPFSNNGLAHDWSAAPATKYQVPIATGGTPFTGKVNFDGTVPRQPYIPPPLSPSVKNGDAQNWTTAPAAQYQAPIATGGTPFTGKVNFDGTVPRQPYVPPPLSPSVKNGGAQDGNTMPAPQYKVLKTHGGSTWTGKSNWNGDQKPASEYWKDDEKAEGDKKGGGDNGGGSAW